MSVASVPQISYFTVSFDLITVNKPVIYDMYVNSSNTNKDRFIKIVNKGETLSTDTVDSFKKYHRVYVSEDERHLYMRSLVSSDSIEDLEKVGVIKDSAVRYLDDIFSPSKEFNTELLGQALEGCHESMKSMVGVIKDYDINNLKNLIGDLSFHDFYTYDHSINVSMYTVLILKHLKPSSTEDELTTAGLGGLLHDLGKVKVPTQILNKTDKLTDQEFAIIKSHPKLGVKIFDDTPMILEGANRDVIKRVIVEHHENWNGTGYPNAIKGEEIHLVSRVCAIADFFDAITTKRSYSDVLPIEDALKVMERTAGKKLDPEMFQFFVDKISRVVLKGKGGIELPEDFDTEKAHKVLPIQKIKPQKISSNFTKPEENKKKKAA